MKSSEGEVFKHCLRLNFFATNNKTEYEDFIVGLRSFSKLMVPELHIFNDSNSVVNQVTSKFEARGARMAKYLASVKTLTKFRAIKIEQMGRDLKEKLDGPSQMI